MLLLRLLLGTILLTMGRKLFWLVIGVVGFLFGFDFAERILHGQSPVVILVIALAAGLVGALLAAFLQKFAVLAGGFIAGGYLLIGLLKELGVATGHYHWLIFLAGGLAGAFLMTILFGWTLILLSSAVGAVLIIEPLHPSPQMTRLIFIFLLLAGVAIQAGLLGRGGRQRR